MGASQSTQHDQANSQQSIENPSTLTSQNSEEEHTTPTSTPTPTLTPTPKVISQKRTEPGSEVKPPPHNYEVIVKDAAIDKSSTEKLYQQLYTGVLLNQKKQKYWVDKKSHANCFMLYARSFSITWSDDKRFWHWPYLSESDGVFVDVAELLNVCWLEVHGKFEASMLSPGVLYEFVFEVMLRDPAYGWEVPVNLRLTLPDGSKQEHKENLMEKPRGSWIEIVIGEFMASHDKGGEIECSLYEYQGGKWKKGLVIKGVAIRPKTSTKVQNV